MSTLQENISKLTLIILFLVSTISKAEDNQPPLTRFVIEGGGGVSKNLDLRGQDENLHGYGSDCILRIKWETGRRFGIGMEGGYLPLASRKGNSRNDRGLSVETKMDMYALPLILFFTFEYSSFQLNAGAGLHEVFSEINAYNETSKSKYLDYGYLVSLGYYYPLATNYGLSLSAKCYYISDMKTTLLSVMLNGFYYF